MRCSNRTPRAQRVPCTGQSGYEGNCSLSSPSPPPVPAPSACRMRACAEHRGGHLPLRREGRHRLRPVEGQTPLFLAISLHRTHLITHTHTYPPTRTHGYTYPLPHQFPRHQLAECGLVQSTVVATSQYDGRAATDFKCARCVFPRARLCDCVIARIVCLRRQGARLRTGDCVSVSLHATAMFVCMRPCVRCT